MLLILLKVTEMEDFVVEVLFQYVTKKKLGKIYLVAHSYGGYHAVNFAHRLEKTCHFEAPRPLTRDCLFFYNVDIPNSSKNS